MADYAIGDIHGCFDTFMRLLQHIGFNPGQDTLWLTGDLVSRGSQSLEVLRWVKQHASCAQTVLGNHDLHLLALAEGCRFVAQEDTLNSILSAKDGQFLLSWLRQQPLVREMDHMVLVHAGLLPKWSMDKVRQSSQEISEALRSTTYLQFLMQLYSNKAMWRQNSSDTIQHLKKTIDVTTRMRCLTHDGKLDFSYQGTIEDMPSRLVPWFSVPTIRPDHYKVVFGHWSAIGPLTSTHALAIDGGCVWGKQLVAIELANHSIHTVSQTAT